MTITVDKSFDILLSYVIQIGLIILLLVSIIFLIKLILIATDIRHSTKIVKKHISIVDKKIIGLYKALNDLKNSIIKKEGFFSFLGAISNLFQKIKEIFTSKSSKNKKAKDKKSEDTETSKKSRKSDETTDEKSKS